MTDNETSQVTKKGVTRFLPSTPREIAFLIVGVLIGVVFLGNSSEPNPSPLPMSVPSSSASQSSISESIEPVTLKQKGDGNSAPFYLVQGSYKVDYVPESSARNCQPQATLEGIESGDSIDLFNLGTQGNGPGTNYVYDIPTGNYYMETSWTYGCEVQVTLSQFLD